MRSSIFTALPIVLIIFVGAVHGFEVDVDPSVGQSVGRATEKGLAATNALENKRKAERAARDAARRAAADSDMGGALNCDLISKNYGLWDYCRTGNCSGFSNNYKLWALCERNDYSGMQYSIYSYLKDGNVSGFKDHRAFSRARQQAGSFADRKRFVIYYLGGYTYE